MRKRFYTYFLYYLELTFVGIFILVLCAYSVTVKQTDFLKRGMYSENVKGIQLSSVYLVNAEGEKVSLEVPLKNVEEDYMLYKRLSEEDDEKIRGIFGTEDTFAFSDYIEEGRFFSQVDYEEKTATAVIGKEMIDHTYVENGKRYYGFQQQLYEVIGIFEETGEDLDQTVYLNLSFWLENADNYGLYYVDAKDSKTVEKVLDSIEKNAEDVYTTSRVAYEAVETYGLNPMNQTLILCAVLSAVLQIVITTIYFIMSKKYVVAVQRMCGMTKRNMAFFYGKRMFGILILAFFTIVLLMKYCAGYMGFFFRLEQLGGVHYGILAIVLCIIGIYLTWHITKLAEQVNISHVLKGR